MSDRQAGLPDDVDACFPDRLLALEGELGSFARSLVRGRANGVDPRDLVQESLARALRFQDTFEPGRPLWPINQSCISSEKLLKIISAGLSLLCMEFCLWKKDKQSFA